MNTATDLRNIIEEILKEHEIGEDLRILIAEKIIDELAANRYVPFDKIDLDPQACVNLLASILNGFKEAKPFLIVEPQEEKTEEVGTDG